MGDQFGPEPRGQSAALVQIRAAQNGVINLNIPALEQQTDKGAAHGAAVGRSDMPAKVRLYVILDFCGFRQYVLKYRLFRLIKAEGENSEAHLARKYTVVARARTVSALSSSPSACS